jgi:hypothetical protein
MNGLGEPAPQQGTSGQEQAGQQGGQFDFERGYNELRPEFTRTTQELSSTRSRLSEYEQLFAALHDSDPEVQRSAMEALGLATDTGSPGSAPAGTDEFVDPLEQEVQQLRSVVDELRSARELEAAEAEEAALTEMRDEYIGEAIGLIESQVNIKFTEREEEVLGNLAIAMVDEKGMPNVQGAYNILYGEDGVLETNRARWIASKTGAAMPPMGTTIPADQKPTTKAQRIAYVDERMRAIDQQG